MLEWAFGECLHTTGSVLCSESLWCYVNQQTLHLQTQSHIKLSSSSIEKKKGSSSCGWLLEGHLCVSCWLSGDVALEPLPRLQSAVQLLVPGQVLSLLEQLEKDSTSWTWLMTHGDRSTDERDRAEHEGWPR